MKPAAKRVLPGPFELFDELKHYGIGPGYEAYVARGPRGWAVYSHDPEPRAFRYLLGRKIDLIPRIGGAQELELTNERADWNARIAANLVLLFVMLNPSTATEQDDDPTIRRCIGYATSWGYSHLWIANAFAWRSTDPYAMVRRHKRGEDVIGPLNDAVIRAATYHADRVVCAWGNHGALGGRAAAVRALIVGDPAEPVGVPHVIKLNRKTGQPVHPLYQPAALDARPWWLVERE